MQDIKQKTNATIKAVKIPDYENKTGITSNDDPIIVLLTLSTVYKEVFFGAFATLAFNIDFLKDFFYVNDRFGF